MDKNLILQDNKINIVFDPASYERGRGNPLTQSDYSPPSTVEDENAWILSSTSHTFSWSES
jgi:hypothetical protein